MAHIDFSTAQFFRRYFEAARHPFFLAHRANAVIEEAAKGVADGAPNEQRRGIGTGFKQSEHDKFGTEREKTASKECSDKHAGRPYLNEGINDFLHLFINRCPSRRFLVMVNKWNVLSGFKDRVRVVSCGGCRQNGQRVQNSLPYPILKANTPISNRRQRPNQMLAQRPRPSVKWWAMSGVLLTM